MVLFLLKFVNVNYTITINENKFIMNQKLLMAVKSLWINFLEPCSEIYHFLNPKNFIGKTALMLFLTLFSLTGYGQLALENFESGIPSTWAQINNGVVVPPTPWTTSTDGYLSSGAAFIDPSAHNIGAGVTERNFLVAPGFNVPPSGEIRFFTKQSSTVDNGNIYEIRLTTANHLDHTSYTTVLATWTEAQLSANPLVYEEKIVPIPSSIAPGIPVHIAFVLVNNQVGATPNADAWYIDNVSALTAQVCDKVLATNFTVSGLTPQTANLSWTHPSASQFEIQLFPSVPVQTPGPTGTATGNSYNPTGLIAGIKYDVYIKTVCSQSSSGWAGPFNFTTPIVGTSCAYPIIVPTTGTPYTYSANLNTFAFAGAPTYTNQGSNCLSPSVTQNYLTGAKAFFSYTPTQDGLISVKNVTSSASFNHSTGVFVYDGCTNVGVQCIGATTTSAVNVPGTTPNIFVQAGHTYFIVVSSNLTATAGIAFTLTINKAQCAPPSVFTYKDLQQTSAKFSWDNVGGFATAWEYKVQAAGAGVPTGAGTATSTNVDNLINTGLVAGTSYDLYVRSVCGGTPGGWSAPYRFTTQCTVFPTPYTQNFTGTSATVPAPCWTAIDVNNDGLFWSYQSSAANLTTNTYQNNNNDYFSTPQVDLGTTPKRLRYKHQIVNGIAKYAIRISSTGVGASNFTTVLMPETAFNNNAYVEKIINIPTSITGPVNIAFVVIPGTGSTATRILIDDVTIEDKPICPDPVTPTATGMTTSTAVLSWTAGDAETQWQIAVQPKGTGLPTGAGVLINSNTYSPTLNHATQYEYYVRAYCDATHQSNWVGPVNFTTLCGAFDVPFYESFNDTDVATTHKFCWSILNANTDNAQWTMQPANPQIQGNAFFGTPSYNDWLISPAINVVGTKELKFKYKAAFSPLFGAPRFGMEVLMSTTDTNPASFSVIMPLIEFTNTDYIEKALYINANGPVYIAFRVPPSFNVANGGTSILMLDDVRIDVAPACPNPSLPLVSNVTQSSAKFSWTPGFMETQWEVKVQPAGTGVPTTAGTLTSSSTNTPSGSLLANTQYEYYVRAYCNGTDQSQWIGPVKFTTLCTPFTTPFLETFEANSATKECWRVTDINNDTFFWFLNMTVNPFEGQYAAAMFTGSNGANNDYLISPTITVGPNQRLRYQYRVTYSDFEEDLEVRLSTTGVEPANFTTELYSVNYGDTSPLNNEEWKEKVINLPAGVTGNINIAWHIPPRPALPQGYRGQSLIIDKVIIEDIPTCPQPTNLVVQNVADTEVELKWDATGTETTWDVYVQPAGLPAPVGDGDPQYAHLATTNPYTVANLNPATKYDCYVRSSCTATDSPWSGPLHFTTMCSFENLCEYTITLANPVNFGDIQGEIQLFQNEVKLQSFNLTTSAGGSSQTFTVFLCNGVEFSLFWDAVGSVPSSGEAQATVTIRKADNTLVWASPPGVGPLNHTIYSGFVSCTPITCPQPINQAVNSNGDLVWTAGGTETQWEVAIQPVHNGTLPTSGTLVSTPTYTPLASDFSVANMATYEYFVRAVCSTTNKSFWSGPYEFVRNDASSKAMVLPVNSGATCVNAITAASFTASTPSAEAMTCAGVNDGDVWFQFNATSKVHIISVDNFSGNYYYANGEAPQPKFTMTLYKVVGATLQQMACTNNNVIVAAYATELEVGTTYKVRLTLNGTSPNAHTFDICVTTPTNPCELNAINGGFETPSQATSGFTQFTRQQVIQGWKTNVPNWDEFFLVGPINTFGVAPYEGGQYIQMLETNVPQDPTDLINVTGTYQDFDSSEITKFNFNYTHAGRSEGRTLQVLAGPPTGPFVLLQEHVGTMAWSIGQGEYVVPASQPVTRFVFRAKNNEIGNLLDAVNITANNEIITQPHTLACNVTQTTLVAEGVGQWIADAANPGPVVITTPNSKTTTVTGFVHSGDYIFHWKTRYCDHTVTVTNIAVDDVPQVVTPVTYCINTVASPLTAPELTEFTLAWYTQPTGGTAIAAPTPSTVAAGTTPYYVAYVNADGCEGSRAQLDVVVNDKTDPVVGFIYDATTYCIIAANPVITLDPNFALNGTFSSTPTGLSIDAVTGAIDLTTSTAGVYDITYDVAAVDCFNSGTNTISVTVTGATQPVVGFTYPNQVCLNSEVALLPIPQNNFTSGGTYTSTTITVDPVTGQIDLATAQAGIHTVTYTVTADTALCVNGDSGTFQIELVAPVTPVTEFTFASSYCVAGTNPLPIMANNFHTGGVFSTQTGLTINALTGEIDLTNSQPGTYQVTYKVEEADCIEENSTTVTVVITPLTTPVVSFNYETPACINSGDELVPTLAGNFNFGGTFSSTTLTVDAETGIIDLNTATDGEHDVIYTFTKDALLCIDGGTFTFKVKLTAGITPVTNFSYDSSYCSDATNALPQLAAGFTPGGIFKSEDGLVLNPTTGQIDVANTKAGSYEITYVIEPDAETCNVGGSFSFTVAIVGSLEAAVSRECRGQNAWLTVTPVNGSFDPNTVNYVWKNENGTVVGSNSAEFNAAEYYALNNTKELPMVFTVTLSSGSCSNEVSYTLHDIMCEIPRGISPNGDGLNDSFDLSGSGVRSLTIFNRYGKKVFSYGANYTNQWHGQDESNNELPDGTYFYSIAKTDGSNSTGWVYINRAH